MRALLLFLLALNAHAADYGISASYITLLPQSSLPAVCNNGDLRYDAVSGYVKVCSANVFSALTTNGLSNFSVASANGLSGTVATVANATTMTLSTTVGAGLLKSNGSGSLVQAVAGTDYLAAGSALLTSNNLSDLTSVSSARTNLGLGSFALKSSLVSADIPNNAANTSGNAATATALAASPTQCATGYHAVGITATGAANCVSDTAAAFPVTTKGDLLGYNTSAARVPVGTDGQILTADSTQALGLSWKAAPATGVTSVGGTAPVVSSGGTTPTISMAQATSSANGYLASSDWSIFNGKQAALTFSSPLNNASNTVSIPVATSSANGYLASSDWSTFNGKQAAGNYLTALTGDVTASGPGSAAATLATTAVTPGSYTLANITVDAKGRITSAANGSAGTTSPLTTKGDIYGFDTANNRVPVGTNGQVLTADSTQTLGLKWATPASGGVTSVTGTAPIVSSGGTAPNITCNTASGSQPGCLASADYTTFSNKQAALTFSGPLSNISNTVSIPQATSSVNGYLASTDWATFNSKQAAGNYITGTTGDVVATGPGSVAATIQPLAVTPAKAANSTMMNDGVQNVGFTPTFASGAMTVTLNDVTGAAFSSTNVGKINFRGSSAGGAPVTRTLTSAVAVTVPSGATLGFKYLKGTPIYVYAVDNAGTQTLGFSGTILQEGTLANTYAFTNTGAGGSVLYTSSALTGVPIKFLGTLTATETALGTYTGTNWDYTVGGNVRTAAATISPFTTEWASYTPTYTGMGTVTSPLFWRRFGPDSIQISGNFTTGTVTSAVPSLTLPNGYTLDSNKVSPGLTAVGKLIRGLTGGANAVEYNLIMLADSSNPGALYFSTANNSLSPTSKLTAGTSGFASSEVELINTLTVPVAQLAGSQAATLITSNPKTLLSGSAVYNASMPTNGSCVPGNYTSYLRAANSSSSFSASPPATLPAAGQGFRIYTSGAPATADAANQPSRFDVCLGAGLDDTNWRVRFGLAAGPTGFLDTTPSYAGTTNFGVLKSYDKSTGILSLVQPYVVSGNMYTGVGLSNSGGVQGGYFEVELATNPLAAGLSTAQDQVSFDTSAGYPSGKYNLYFTNASSQGSSMSYVNNSTSGALVTINRTGVYCLNGSFGAAASSNSVIGIIKNGSAYYTTPVQNIPTSVRKAYSSISAVSGATFVASTSYCDNLNQGDVLAVITDGTASGVAAASYFNITKVPDPFTTAQGQSGYSGEVSAQAYATASISATANTPVILPAVAWDTSGIYNATTGRFTVPANQGGHYSFTCQGFFMTTAASVYAFKNGVKDDAMQTLAAGYAGSAAWEGMLNPGDYMQWAPDTNQTIGYSATINVTKCMLKKIN